MRRYVIAVAVLAILAAMSPAAVKCEKWGKWGFIRKATPAEVRACLAQGANPNEVQGRPRSILSRAIIHAKNEEVIATLIDAGADPNMKEESSGSTALHYEAGSGHRAWVIRKLLDAGADPNARNVLGWTPLHEGLYGKAKYEVSCEILEALLEGGADPNLLTEKGHLGVKKGQSAMDLADADHNRMVLANAGGRHRKPPKSRSGFGAIAAGVLGAVVASEAGLNDDEALGVGQDAADTVRTGTPTSRSTTAAMDRTRVAEEAAALREQIQRDMEQAVIDALAARDALAAEPGAAPDTQQEVEEKLRQQERQRQQQEARRQELERIKAANAKLLSGNCQCIRIQDNGEYSCLDGFVVGSNSKGRPCDISR